MGFGLNSVSSLKRVPRPPASIKAFKVHLTKFRPSQIHHF
jgi:hypothetical protein